MLHICKSNLLLLVFEKDITKSTDEFIAFSSENQLVGLFS